MSFVQYSILLFWSCVSTGTVELNGLDIVKGDPGQEVEVLDDGHHLALHLPEDDGEGEEMKGQSW